jgi:hypothetical protein
MLVLGHEYKKETIDKAIEIYLTHDSDMECVAAMLECSLSTAYKVIYKCTNKRRNGKKIHKNYNGCLKNRMEKRKGKYLTLFERKDTDCSFIMDFQDEKGNSVCCGKKTVNGSSFCEEHHAICYEKKSTNKRLEHMASLNTDDYKRD